MSKINAGAVGIPTQNRWYFNNLRGASIRFYPTIDAAIQTKKQSLWLVDERLQNDSSMEGLRALGHAVLVLTKSTILTPQQLEGGYLQYENIPSRLNKK